MTGYASRWKMLAGVAALVVLGTGCQTIKPLTPIAIGPVEPGPYETIVTEHVYVAVDLTGSMQEPDKYPVALQLAQAFVDGMPEGTYTTSMVAFGGPPKDAWAVYETRSLDRGSLQQFAESLEYIGGVTELDDALMHWEESVAALPGESAIVIFSDGETWIYDNAQAVNQLEAVHDGSLCVYAVHIDDSVEGQLVMREIANEAACGGYFAGEELQLAGGMEGFIRLVFFRGMPDADGDGVPDAFDECPNTPRGAPVDERGCWVLAGLFFETDKAIIQPQYMPIIEEAAEVLRMNPGIRVFVDGHTDSRASDAYNQRLSERRATAVRNALIEQGIAPDRLVARGFGESQPAAPNTSAANMQLNRRVELTLIAE